MKTFYKQGVQRGGWIIGGVPEHSEHGRVYAGTITFFVSHLTGLKAEAHANALPLRFRGTIFVFEWTYGTT